MWGSAQGTGGWGLPGGPAEAPSPTNAHGVWAHPSPRGSPRSLSVALGPGSPAAEPEPPPLTGACEHETSLSGSRQGRGRRLSGLHSWAPQGSLRPGFHGGGDSRAQPPGRGGEGTPRHGHRGPGRVWPRPCWGRIPGSTGSTCGTGRPFCPVRPVPAPGTPSLSLTSLPPLGACPFPSAPRRGKPGAWQMQTTGKVISAGPPESLWPHRAARWVCPGDSGRFRPSPRGVGEGREGGLQGAGPHACPRPRTLTPSQHQLPDVSHQDDPPGRGWVRPGPCGAQDGGPARAGSTPASAGAAGRMGPQLLLGSEQRTPRCVCRPQIKQMTFIGKAIFFLQCLSVKRIDSVSTKGCLLEKIKQFAANFLWWKKSALATNE